MSDLDAINPTPSVPQIVTRSAPVVFIHASPRTSSTWFWAKFRELPSTLCFCEPFNFCLNWLTHETIAQLHPGAWESRHPPIDPYYREYAPLLREAGGVQFFDPAMTLQWFIPQGGLRGALRPSETDYLRGLIHHAEQAGKIPVFGDCWSLGRLAAMKQALGGFHIFQYRNLWRQWLSYLSFKRQGDMTFYVTTPDIIVRDDDPFFAYLVRRGLSYPGTDKLGRPDLLWTRPYVNVVRDEAEVRRLELLAEHHAFALFMGLHIYLYLHARSCADLSADATRMARDPGYRADIERAVRQHTGLTASFADAADVERPGGLDVDTGAIDWNEIREHARVAVEMLSAFADPEQLTANATALIDDAMREMRKAEAPGAALAAERTAPHHAQPAGQPQKDPAVTSIGLCMIVKNEAPVIRRCLDSVRPIIGHWVIVDTGSTDGTQDIIREHLRDLPGELHERPWRDFAHNRSEALELARGKAGYTLIIDADDTLEIEAGTAPPALSADSYTVEIADSATLYRRIQLVRSALPWHYEGVLHEFVTCDGAGPSGHLSGIRMRRNHDGARRKDPQTYRRDVAVLEAALQTETRPFLIARYRFYLAQSYRDCGEAAKALQNYLLRAELGFWQQEVFVSLYYAAKMKEQLGHPEQEVINAYLRAADALPTRAEALHGASRFCRCKGRNEEGCRIAKRGLEIPLPADALFVEPWIYETGLLDEFAVNAYWCGQYRDCLDASLKILATGKLSGPDMQRAVANARFATEKLPTPAPPNLGTLGAESLIDQHKLVPQRALRSRVNGSPRVLVAILAKQKEWALPLYLECIEALDYPKSSIVLYIRTNNNTDRTEQILREWVERVGNLYAEVEFDASDVSDRVEQFAPHEWNATRFRVLGRIRNTSLRRALEHECDFYFVADVDNFIRPCTLRELVALDLPIAAPLLRSIAPGQFYSNYHAEIDPNGYYKDCDQYHWILHRWLRGVVEVPVVHCTYLVRADVLNDLTYDDATNRFEYVVFADSARRSGVPQYFDNRQVYGYITFGDDDSRYLASGVEQARALLHANRSECRNGYSQNIENRLTVLVHPKMTKFLDSMINMLVEGLREISIEPDLTHQIRSGFSGRAIILGANFYRPDELNSLRQNSIIFNVENPASSLMTEDYLRLLDRFTVWDYSPGNAREMSIRLRKPVHYFRMFYVNSLSRIKDTDEPDIDVLFYGSFNARRIKILDALRERGLVVEAVFRVFGDRLDRLIARSKVVINIHQHDNGRLEMIRLFDLMANGRAIVSELNPGEFVDPDLANAFVAASYEDVVGATEALVHDPGRRRKQASTAFKAFSQCRASPILSQALAWSEAAIMGSRNPG